jgi:hypothetical protein
MAIEPTLEEFQTGFPNPPLEEFEGEIPLEEEEEEVEEAFSLDDEEEKKLLVDTRNKYFSEDQGFRQRHLRKLKKADLYWEGEQRIFWDDSSEDYRSINTLSLTEWDQYGLSAFDRVINIYRPLGESVIAALTIELPNVKFFPNDADNPNDVQKARAHSLIVDLLQRHTKAPLLLIKALTVAYNQGMIAAYCYLHQDAKYGSYSYEESKEETTEELDPLTGMMTPTTKTVVERFKDDKSRVCIDIYGALNVQVPAWVRYQKDTPYLRFSFEQHVSLVRAAYAGGDTEEDRELFDKIKPDYYGENYDERAARQKDHDDTHQLCTIEVIWYRPWALAIHNNEEFKFLRDKYPKGCKVVICNRDLVLERTEEALDDHWSLSFPIYSETIHQLPMGAGAIEIQELRNDGVNLADQTLRQAIPETFASPDVLDFNAYAKAPKKPGQVFKTKPIPVTASIGSGFHTLKTATLSDGLDVYIGRLDADGQFVTGAFPSVYGGPSESGSKTASEYAQSRSQALQRLSTSWKMVSFLWSDTYFKASNLYAEYLKETQQDEKFAKALGSQYVNVWIRHSELDGDLGEVTPEASENFPITGAQKADLIRDMIKQGDDAIRNVLFHPENAELVAITLGVPELYIPGADDRNKQLWEIQELIMGAPTPSQVQAGQMEPSVLPDFDVDDHQVHIDVLKAYLVGAVGIQLNKDNEEGYANCIAHLKLHIFMQQMKAQELNATAPGEPDKTNASGSPQ